MVGPKVSILIPLYNSEKYIEETVQSALTQSWVNKEIIIVDDHSSDKSFEIAKKFESEIVKIYKNDGKGACAARNMAFEKSTGDYIQYLDADDLLSPYKIEKQMNALNGFNDRVAYCDNYLFYGNIQKLIDLNNTLLHNFSKPSDFLIHLWGGYKNKPSYISVHSWLCHRKLISTAGVWNIKLLKDQDGEFFCRVLLAAKQIVYVPGAYTYYRKFIGGNNVASGKSLQHFQSILKATELKEKYLFQLIANTHAQYAIATQYKIIAIDAYPMYKDISNYALHCSKKLGYSVFVPELGGIIIETIKKTLGWKSAKFFSYIIHNNKLYHLILKK